MENLDIAGPLRVLRNVVVGERVMIWNFVNAYECEIGDDSIVGSFVEIQSGVKIGRRCRIQSHSFLCEGVTLEDEVFVAHGVMFINDNYPSGHPSHLSDWDLRPTLVRKGAAIGSGTVVLGGVTIGENALVGAGAVVTHDVPDNGCVIGVPARPHRGESSPFDRIGGPTESR
jgi:UDP-2-acetamido-3-amino-2,3-dideoxy-glucuronate N-acetyltransferase